jgi:hypothetical protein
MRQHERSLHRPSDSAERSSWAFGNQASCYLEKERPATAVDEASQFVMV